MLDWAQLETNPYLRDNACPIEEEMEVARCEVIGEIPEALSGAFLRNGSNQQYEPRGPYHLFDGDGMIHAVYLENGQAGYRNRWILSKGLEYERKVGHAIWGGMRDVFPPDEQALAEVGRAKNVANIHLVEHAGHLLALWEAGKPTEVTAQLETVGEYSFGGKLKGGFCAHPHFDERTGEMFGFAYRPIPPFLMYYVVDKHGQLKVSEEIPVEKPVMMHDFAISENYAVFFYAPAVWDVIKAIQEGGPAMTWQPERGCQIGLMPRYGKGSEIRWFEADVGWCFHFANAFERGNEVILDAVRTDRVDDDVNAADDGGYTVGSLLTRFTVNLETGGRATTQQFMTERHCEFPRVARHIEGQHHRYAYMLGTDNATDLVAFDSFNHVCRFDYETGESNVFKVDDLGGDATEFSYAPNPESDREEDGWLMGYVYRKATHSSELVILSAGDPSAGPVARVLLPQRVPEGFHGSWIPGLPFT